MGRGARATEADGLGSTLAGPLREVFVVGRGDRRALLVRIPHRFAFMCGGSLTVGVGDV